MIAQRLPDDDDDESPSGWAIVWPLLFFGLSLAGSLGFA